MVMEVKKSHNLVSTSWKTRKAGDIVIQFKVQGPKSENWSGGLLLV